MARAQSIEHLQAFRFELIDNGGDVRNSQRVLNEEIDGQAVGFQSISGLSMSAEIEEVREGNWPFPHHVVKAGSVGAITLSRGIVPKDSDFYLWFMACLYGKDLTRRTLTLNILRRPDRERLPAAATSTLGLAENSSVLIKRIGKSYLLHECIPTELNLYGELDANTSDVLVAELGIQPGYVEELIVR